LNFAHGVFAFAVKRAITITNPVAAADRPRTAGGDPDIRYLDRAEVEALLRAVPDDVLGPTDRAIYLTATMTGLRQGELAALRWRDVDWPAGLVRVRRNYTRGEWGTPKSRRSSRAVPMADLLAAELDRHYQRSAYQADDDLVFGHPQTGNPYDASRMRTRFKRALKAANVREVAFTTCATHTARGWRLPARRFGRCRDGWATRATRRRRSTPTSRPTRHREPRSPRRPSVRLPICLPI